MAVSKSNKVYAWTIKTLKEKRVLWFRGTTDQAIAKYQEAQDVWPGQGFELYCGDKLVSKEDIKA